MTHVRTTVTAAGATPWSGDATANLGFTQATAGNLLIVAIGLLSNRTVTTPSGYTASANNQAQAAVFENTQTNFFWKIADGSETSVDVTLSSTSGGIGFLAVLEYSGIDAGDAFEGSGTPSVTGATSGTVTAAGPSNLVIAAFGDGSADANDPGAESLWTARVDQNRYVVADLLDTSGSHAHTATGTSVSGASIIFAFNGTSGDTVIEMPVGAVAVTGYVSAASAIGPSANDALIVIRQA